MRGGDLDGAVEVGGNESRVDVAESRDEERGGIGESGEDLGADGDGGDVDGGDVGNDVAGDPVGGSGVGLAYREDLLVGDGDGNANAGVGERRQHGRVGVVETDVVDVLRFQQRRHLRRRRHVGERHADVDANVGTCRENAKLAAKTTDSNVRRCKKEIGIVPQAHMPQRQLGSNVNNQKI